MHAAMLSAQWSSPSAGAHVITIIKAPGMYVHNKMVPSADSPGAFVVNSKKIAGNSVDALIQRWLASPAGTFARPGGAFRGFGMPDASAVGE